MNRKISVIWLRKDSPTKNKVKVRKKCNKEENISNVFMIKGRFWFKAEVKKMDYVKKRLERGKLWIEKRILNL
jgi:hypothetical protein